MFRPKSREETAEVVAWFVALMHGLERGELTKAAAAQDELVRLGVKVSFPRSKPGQRKGGLAHVSD